jgi:hypothetical protein
MSQRRPVNIAAVGSHGNRNGLNSARDRESLFMPVDSGGETVTPVLAFGSWICRKAALGSVTQVDVGHMVE